MTYTEDSLDVPILVLQFTLSLRLVVCSGDLSVHVPIFTRVGAFNTCSVGTGSTSDFLQGSYVILSFFSATSRLFATVVRTLPTSYTEPTALMSYSMAPSITSVVVARASLHSVTVFTQVVLCFSVLSCVLL